ncbi:4'-phosphopantetheinyl transferase family protein [Streptomyces sp. NRRL S-1022]|uniref:4'-phosphopantetheinyl transferase family protein n=1 Tax=Streptomyces sp. NRRL S-1022 TaxID=1463880 RepID=UPI00099DD5A9|nr:4'-phosphopantetheinyl transferase superfamily protein [Streptomyces sp. NRRL S-1022]
MTAPPGAPTTTLAKAPEVLLGAPRADSFTAFGRRVDIWVAEIGAPPGAGRLRSGELLSRADAERAARIAAPGGRARFTGGRALARWVLAVRLGCLPAEVPIVTGPGGRPELAGGGRSPAHGQASERIDFNVSHSGNQVAVVLARGLRVGIDIERVVERDSAADVADRVFSVAERELLRRTPRAAYPARWYRIWTTREAYVKARGTGLSGITADLPALGTSWLAHGVRGVPRDYAATAVACRTDPRV